MPAAETTRDMRAPRLLTGAFWSGVGLAPLALLIMVVGGSAGAIEVALSLGLVSIVLIGLSIAMRREAVPVRSEIEQLVYDEVDTLRDDIREDIAHAARSTHKSLADRIVHLSETVDVLRGQIDTMRDQVDRVAAPSVAPHTTGVGHVPGGVLRHTETVQVTTRQTMLVDPHDTNRDGTVYGGRQPGFVPAGDQGFRGPGSDQGFRGPGSDQGFRGAEPDRGYRGPSPERRRDTQPLPDDRPRGSARPPQAPGPEESRSGRARVGGRPEQAPAGRARVEHEGFDHGGSTGRVPQGAPPAVSPGQDSRSGRARVGVGRPEQAPAGRARVEGFDGTAGGRPDAVHDLAARGGVPRGGGGVPRDDRRDDTGEARRGAGGARRGDTGEIRRRGAGDAPPPRSGLAEVFQQRRAESAAAGRDTTGRQVPPGRGTADQPGPAPSIPQPRRPAALESGPRQESWSDQMLRERLNRPEPEDRDRVGRRRADAEPEERTGRRRREEPSSGDAWSPRRPDEPSSGDAWSPRRSVDDHDGSGEWTGGRAGRRRAPDVGGAPHVGRAPDAGYERVDVESDSGRLRDRPSVDDGRGYGDTGGRTPGRRRAPEDGYDREVPDGGGRRRAYEPGDEGGRITGVRTADRWASVRSDDQGARELRMGERRSAVHEDATGTELHIEDRWASVRKEPGPRRSQARQDRDRGAWGTGEPSEQWTPADRVEAGWSEARWDDGAWRGGTAPALPAAPQADDDNYAWNRPAAGDRGGNSHRLVDFEDDDDRWR